VLKRSNAEAEPPILFLKLSDALVTALRLLIILLGLKQFGVSTFLL
jgi:hypothetical protein